MSRRTLILVAAAAAVALLGGIVYVAAGGDDARRVGAIDQRSYVAGRAALTSEGVFLGFLRSASCGSVGADVADVPPNPELKAPGGKQIGPAKYQPCEFSFSLAAMDKSLYSWISDALAGKAGRKNLTIQHLNYEYDEVTRLELTQAGISRFTMPTLNGSSNQAVFMTLTVVPQSISAQPGSGAKITGPTTAKQKLQLANGYRFEWAGQPVTKVSKIESWSIDYDAAAQRPVLGDITIVVSESDPRMGALDSSFRKFVIEGVNGSKAETTAAITLLDPGLTPTATLAFTGVGWASGDLLGTSEVEANADAAIARREYTLYAEGATLTLP